MAKSTTKTKERCIVIGAGVSGLASAALLAHKGYDVTVLEGAETYGGKLGITKVGGATFDTGPSLCTDVATIDSVYERCGKNPRAYWNYTKLTELSRYFWHDAQPQVYTMPADISEIQNTIENDFGERPEKVQRYFDRLLTLYAKVAPYYIDSPLKMSALLRPSVLIAFMKLFPYVITAQHRMNAKYFSSPHTIQLFDRYATYSGSDPYRAPAVMGFAGVPEILDGAYFPTGGMRSIADGLYKLCLDVGVTFHFSHKVSCIQHRNGTASAVVTNSNTFQCELVVYGGDVAYLHELTAEAKSNAFTKQERSTSAFVFYWEVKDIHKELGLHNIIFSNSYKQEYEALSKNSVTKDPTIYINITCKQDATHAKPSTENWFVMVNVPAGTKDAAVKNIRNNVLSTIQQTLHFTPIILNDSVLTPSSLNNHTGAWQGAIYGQATNSVWSLLNRPKNHSKKYKNIYMVGGTVHPGGGIPLAIRSAIMTIETL